MCKKKNIYICVLRTQSTECNTITAKINKNKIPFRIPSGISFVNINTQTGLQTNSKDGILEPFIVGTEPFNKSITVLDSLGSVRKDTLSGTGNLIID